MMDAFRLHQSVSFAFGVNVSVSRIAMTHTTNHVINKRLGLPQSVLGLKRESMIGSDSRELLSESDLIVSAAVVWLSSHLRKTPLRGFLCKQFRAKKKVETTSSEDVYDSLKAQMMIIDRSVSRDDMHIIVESVKCTDMWMNYNPGDVDDFGLDITTDPNTNELRYFMHTAAFVCMCVLSSDSNINKLIKDPFYKFSNLKENLQIILESIEPLHTYAYFTGALTKSLEYISRTFAAINFIEKVPEGDSDDEPEDTPTRKRQSPIRKKERIDPRTSSYVETDTEDDDSESVDEELDDDNEDGYTSLRGQKIARTRNGRAISAPVRNDPFKKIEATFQALSSELQIPPYKIGMDITKIDYRPARPRIIPEEEPLPPPPPLRLIRDIGGPRDYPTYAEYKQKLEGPQSHQSHPSRSRSRKFVDTFASRYDTSDNPEVSDEDVEDQLVIQTDDENADYYITVGDSPKEEEAEEDSELEEDEEGDLVVHEDEEICMVDTSSPPSSPSSPSSSYDKFNKVTGFIMF